MTLLRRAPNGSQQMRVRKHSSPIFGELCQHGEFLRRQVDLVTPFANGAPGKVDHNIARNDRLIVRSRSQVEQVRNIAVQLQSLGAELGDGRLVSQTLPPKPSDNTIYDPEGGPNILRDRRQQRGTQPIPLTGGGKSACLAFEPCALQRQRRLIQ